MPKQIGVTFTNRIEKFNNKSYTTYLKLDINFDQIIKFNNKIG